MMQEAYVRGVSSWNFDVAALKSNAALEGASELVSVPEGTGAFPLCAPRESGHSLWETAMIFPGEGIYDMDMDKPVALWTISSTQLFLCRFLCHFGLGVRNDSVLTGL
jgi:hypothetical protein